MAIVKMAKRHLGQCPTCNGNIGWGHLYILRRRVAYHTQCDPERPLPICWCGDEIGETETEHQACFDSRRAVAWFMRAMTGIFSPIPVAKFPRMRA